MSFVFKSYVEINKNAKWCPGTDCKQVCEYFGGDAIDIICAECGEDFCFSCLKKAHKPIDCETLTLWLDRISNGDEDSNNWIKVNTKKCPKCKSPI